MFSALDFSIIANNDNSIGVLITNPDGTPFSLLNYAIAWGIFKNGSQVFGKVSSDAAQILIPDQTLPQNMGRFTLFIDATDTINLETETEYVHEFVFTDNSANSVNASKGDKCLTPGKVYVRRQFKAQT